jgi:hypothetical protein
VRIRRLKLAAKTDPVADVDPAVVQPEQARPAIGPALAKQGKKHTVGAVPMTLKELYEEAWHLPREQAAELIDLLLIDTFSLPEPDVDEAWKNETRRRIAEIESGQVKGIPMEETLAKMRKIVGL